MGSTFPPDDGRGGPPPHHPGQPGPGGGYPTHEPGYGTGQPPGQPGPGGGYPAHEPGYGTGQPPGQPPETGVYGGEGPPKGPNRLVFVIVGVLLLLGVGVALAFILGFFGGGDDDEEVQVEVYVTGAGETGPDPFSPEPFVSKPPPPELAKPITMDDSLLTTTKGLQLVADSGATPGLYGGSMNESVCDIVLMIDYLEANPTLAAAWVDAFNADPDLGFAGGTLEVATLGAYVDTLTPAILLQDTRVTNHGFRNGTANAFQDTLQKGHAVLLDEFGVPRIKCYCGNPLLAPDSIDAEIVYRGKAWEDYDPARVRTVDRSTQPITTFVLVDVQTGQQFQRPAGGDGSDDQPTSPTGETTTTTTAPEPTTSTTEPSTTTSSSTTTEAPTTSTEAPTTETTPPDSSQPPPTICTPAETTDEATMVVTNNTTTPLDIVWNNFDCDQQYFVTLQPGESFRQGTFVGHRWSANQPDGTTVSNHEVAAVDDQWTIG